MAKSEGQKAKLLYLLKILTEETDEFHPLSTKDLIERLARLDIKAERKTIYSDISTLQDFGLDILYSGTHQAGGYYLASRDFELAELKMLVDMVQSSRFLSERKSKELIRKLESLTGKYEAASLKRTVYVSKRAKSQNESVFYAVDAIHRAIGEDRAVDFQYQIYTPSQDQELKSGGKTYHVSPYYLTWNNENYYMIGYDETRGEIRNYRVDRMKGIRESERKRQGREAFEGFDIESYSAVSFNMFSGTAKRIKLLCDNELAGVIIDRFGKDISLHKAGEMKFEVNVDVAASPQFYGWLAGLGRRARIVAPASEVQNYQQYLQEILLDYHSG